jgi:hypothetical protein
MVRTQVELEVYVTGETSSAHHPALAHVGVEPYELSDNKGYIFAMAG